MKYNYTLLFLILIFGSIKGQNIDSKFALSNANKNISNLLKSFDDLKDLRKRIIFKINVFF